MTRGVSPNLPVTYVADAVRDGDWRAARKAMAERLGSAFDQTDSARDLKAIAMSLVPLIESCEVDEQRNMDRSDTPLASLMAEADEQGF